MIVSVATRRTTMLLRLSLGQLLRVQGPSSCFENHQSRSQVFYTRLDSVPRLTSLLLLGMRHLELFKFVVSVAEGPGAATPVCKAIGMPPRCYLSEAVLSMPITP